MHRLGYANPFKYKAMRTHQRQLTINSENPIKISNNPLDPKI